METPVIWSLALVAFGFLIDVVEPCATREDSFLDRHNKLFSFQKSLELFGRDDFINWQQAIVVFAVNVSIACQQRAIDGSLCMRKTTKERELEMS